MKNLTNILLVVLIVLSVGLYFHSPKSTAQFTAGVTSSAGVTNSTAKLFSVTMSPSVASATTTSLLNSDSTDRMITGNILGCTGVGNSQAYLTGAGLLTGGWALQFSTSTVGSTGLQGNLNYAGNISIATSSAWLQQASSTLGVLGAVGLVWPASTYLNFTFNATNTAACTIGVSAISL